MAKVIAILPLELRQPFFRSLKTRVSNFKLLSSSQEWLNFSNFFWINSFWKRHHGKLRSNPQDYEHIDGIEKINTFSNLPWNRSHLLIYHTTFQNTIFKSLCRLRKKIWHENRKIDYTPKSPKSKPQRWKILYLGYIFEKHRKPWRKNSPTR